jgi:hypothetical protein
MTSYITSSLSHVQKRNDESTQMLVWYTLSDSMGPWAAVFQLYYRNLEKMTHVTQR